VDSGQCNVAVHRIYNIYVVYMYIIHNILYIPPHVMLGPYTIYVHSTVVQYIRVHTTASN
jgi:hypothetical protein